MSSDVAVPMNDLSNNTAAPARTSSPDPASAPASASRARRLLESLLEATIPELRREEEVEAEEDDEEVDRYDLRVRNNYGKRFNLYFPAAIPVAVLAQVVTFIVYAARLGDVTFATGGVDFKSPLIYNPSRRHEAWRFLSYALLHHGVFHLLTNSLVLLSLGCFLEIMHSWVRVTPVLLIGIAAGSLASSVFDATAFLVGASGGAYAIIGGHLATVVINWRVMQNKWLNSPMDFAKSGAVRLTVLLGLLVLDTAVAVYTRYSGAASKVSYAAHGGGFVAGLLIGICCLTNLQPEPWKRRLSIATAALLAVLMVAGIIFNAFCAGPKLCPSIAKSRTTAAL